MATQALKRSVPEIGRDISMEELQRLYPQVIPVLNRHRMYCVGCLLAAFHDIHDAAVEHGLDEGQLRADILAAVVTGKARNW
ncbi:MAG: hypothetical protein KDJ80_15545 [Nitratireductor sp.]|nr:hypothetical protein [Nitratireductor sp.]